MTGITASIENLLASIFGVFRSILNALLSSFQGVFAIFGTTVESVFDLVNALFQFLISNFLILAVLAAAFVGYTMYAQRTGKTVSGGKKTT